MTSLEVIAGSIVPGSKSVFFLGCFESRVTVLAQQIRALNLVDALIDTGAFREDGKVAIVGGGVAGITVAAALAVSRPKLRAIDLYERKPELLHLQTSSPDRYLHPHIYDWPQSGTLECNAGLPLMNWSAGSAEHVARRLHEQFDQIKNISRALSVKTSRTIEKLTPFPLGGCRVHVAGAPQDGDIYDAVIICIGFGYESYIGELNLSYWSPSLLSGSIRNPEDEHLVFVSGNGDGGLVDFMMAAYRGMGHRLICELITGFGGLGAAEAALLEIEERAWNGTGVVDIYDEYVNGILPILPQHMLIGISENLRPDVRTILHTRDNHLFRRDTSVLNRFATFLAIMADQNTSRNKIEVHIGKPFVGGRVPIAGEVQIEGRAPFTPTYRLLRLGAERDKNLAPFRLLADAYLAGIPSTTSRYRPATPTLNPTVLVRFATASARLDLGVTPGPVSATPTNLASTVVLRIKRQSDGLFSWCGDVPLTALHRVWEEETHLVKLICDVPENDAGPLVPALARICAHARSCEFICSDGRRWEETLRCFTGRFLPGPNVDIHFTVTSPPPAEVADAPHVVSSGASIAKQVHSILDAYLLSDLHHHLRQCLVGNPPVEVGWIMQSELRHRMWNMWERWRAQLLANESDCRRFMLLLATERDEVSPADNELVRLGPRIMRPHLLRAAIFSLAFATGSEQEFLPSRAHPGNIFSPTITGHASGVSWIDGEDIGPEVVSRRWTTGLILLSELRESSQLLQSQSLRLDQSPDDPARISDLGPDEQPIIIGCDHAFRRAMEVGTDAVSAYIDGVLQDRTTSAVERLERER